MKRGQSMKSYKKYWLRLKEAVAEFKHSLGKIESEMQEETENPEIEFYFKDGRCIGIKDSDKVVPEDELEQ